MSEHILATSDFNEKQQQLVRNFFSESETKVDFLGTASAEKRSQIIQQITIWLTLNPAHDLRGDEFDLLRNLRFIQLTSAGADHLPYEKIPDDILLASNPGAYANPMAEHVVAMALALAKRLREEHQNMQNGEFNQFAKNKYIRDSTIGILGFGGIGQATARLFRAFGLQIFAMNTSGESDEPTDFIGTTDDLRYILSSSDIVVLSLPLNKATRGLINKKQLEWMKPDAILINVARGEIISQKDLYEHLKNYPNFKAGLESWWVEPERHGKFKLDYPLLDLPNVLASPHNSSMVPGIVEHGIEKALKNIKKYLNNKPIKGEINRENFV